MVKSTQQKRFLNRLFFMAIFVFFGLTGVYSSAFAVNPEGVKISPAEGICTSLQTFTITFENAKTVTNTINGDTGRAPRLEHDGQRWATATSVIINGNTVTYSIGSFAYTTPGNYKFIVPATAYQLDNEQSSELVFNYEIKASEETLKYTLNPVVGDVDNLGIIEVIFDNAPSLIEKQKNATTLKNNDGIVEIQTEVKYNNRYIITIAENAASANGTYTLTIPAGTLEICGLENKEIIAVYNVNHPVNNIATIDPPTEDKYESLSSFTITFKANKVEVTDAGNNISKPYLLLPSSGDTKLVKTVTVKNSNQLYMELSEEVKSPGSYVFIVPAEAYKIDGEQGMLLSFEYTITNETGISGIIATDVYESTIYNMNGFKMSIKDVNKLVKGVYIINGKKYVVK